MHALYVCMYVEIQSYIKCGNVVAQGGESLRIVYVFPPLLLTISRSSAKLFVKRSSFVTENSAKQVTTTSLYLVSTQQYKRSIFHNTDTTS